MKNLESNNVIWTPNIGSQTLFLSCPYKETFYFGTRKGGKTSALLIDFLQGVGKGFGPYWRGILFRRTFRQLRDIAINTRILFKKAFPKAHFNAQDGIWTFPDGETLFLSYFWDSKDYTNYHGQSFPWIGWDELCEWSDLDGYELMKSCNVSTAEGIPVRTRATGNTWGIGRNHVKKYFIDPNGTWGIPIKNTENFKRIAIFGDMIENIPFMEYQQGKDFRKSLFTLSDKELVKAWVFGSWDVKIGGFFSDVWDERKNIIPIRKCFIPPKHWFCFRSFDWGSASPFSVGWWCESDGTEAPNGITYPKGALIQFAEWYGADDNKANVGIYLSNPDIGQGIVDREKQWDLYIRKGPADTQIFEERGGDSIHKQMKYNLFVPADKTRVTGWSQFRDRLKGSEDEGPLIYFMEWCKNSIRTIPYIQRDDKKLEDIANQQEDHICLSPNTMIKTINGFKPIKDLVNSSGQIITIGNFYTDYYNCKLTKKDQELIRLTFEDGITIESTLDHKFLDINCNLIQAKDLKIGNYCYSFKGENECKPLSLVKQYKNLMELDTTYKENILEKQMKDYYKDYYIEKFGNFIMDQYQKEFIFIQNLYAEKNLEQINIKRLKLVQEIVEQNSAEKIGKKIKAIDYIGKSDVYCLTTKGTHLFGVQGNIIVSNCDMVRYSCMFRKMKSKLQIFDPSEILLT